MPTSGGHGTKLPQASVSAASWAYQIAGATLATLPFLEDVDWMKGCGDLLPGTLGCLQIQRSCCALYGPVLASTAVTAPGRYCPKVALLTFGTETQWTEDMCESSPRVAGGQSGDWQQSAGRKPGSNLRIVSV